MDGLKEMEGPLAGGAATLAWAPLARGWLRAGAEGTVGGAATRGLEAGEGARERTGSEDTVGRRSRGSAVSISSTVAGERWPDAAPTAMRWGCSTGGRLGSALPPRWAGEGR